MNKPRVLVAEKDGPLRDVFQMALTARGYEALVAADIRECLEQLRTGRTDVLMLDRELPPSGDSGLVDKIRNGTVARQVPIVLLAGQGSPGALARLVVSPVIACLQKPFQFSYLLEILSTAIDLPQMESVQVVCATGARSRLKRGETLPPSARSRARAVAGL